MRESSTADQRSDSEVVERAIEILDDKGWCQGTQVNRAGQVCVGEALAQASGAHLWNATWWVRLPGAQWRQFCRVRAEVTAIVVTRWNDQPGMTAEYVQERLILTAKRLREEGR